MDNGEIKYDGSKGLLGLSTMYKIGSRPDLRPSKAGVEGEFKVVEDYSGVNIEEKPNLIFGKSDSVMDDEGKIKALFININFQLIFMP